MDTRDKIVQPEEASARLDQWKKRGERVVVARGTFDPLLAAHVHVLEAMAEAESRIAVFVVEGRAPILPPAVRAELVAALRCVDLVVAGDPPPELDVHDLTAADELRTAGFIEHVHRRNQAQK